jgi:hypothetical protein
MALSYFEQTEPCQSPFLETRHGLDRELFRPVMDESYTLHGWDSVCGWLSRERLHALSLQDLYEPMIVGASKAWESAGGARAESQRNCDDGAPR